MNLIAAIDQGTSSTRVIVFEAGKINVVASHQIEVQQFCPQEGWMEQDAIELWTSVQDCIKIVVAQLTKTGSTIQDIKAIGLTNQRESTIIWDRTKTGLPIATYFSATKLLWLIKNNPEVKEAIEKKTVMFGTVDSWILWNLTGGIQCNYSIIQHAKLQLNQDKNIFGTVKGGEFDGIQITGIIGDQQAALLGHGCTNKEEAKSTYGTGCFLLYNTGKEMVKSEHGLLTTVAYQCAGKPANFALEGSVAVAGSAVRWLQNNLGLINKSSEISELAAKVESTDGVYFVPAFSGLFAPYWKPDARGIFCGLTAHTTKHHIARSVLEATCFQVMDIFQAMRADSKSDLCHVLVDGGMTASKEMLQIQADIAGVDVICPQFNEITAVGAAVAAGATVNLWNLGQKMDNIVKYSPKISSEEREKMTKKWKMAVERSLGWHTD